MPPPRPHSRRYWPELPPELPRELLLGLGDESDLDLEDLWLLLEWLLLEWLLRELLLWLLLELDELSSSLSISSSSAASALYEPHGSGHSGGTSFRPALASSRATFSSLCCRPADSSPVCAIATRALYTENF